ncbi:MAG: DoxX family membrane protein [Pseudomonadales bacterium]|nr:DoxX family membrane protein [Pseudomonadales bacterium]
MIYSKILNQSRETPHDSIALILRIGLGAVFFIGGWSKLNQLLRPALSDGILASYYGTSGYVNAFFEQYLFQGPVLGSFFTEWGFLTSLSTFELITGTLLLLGIAVRPLALIYGLLLWTFVMALPVITVSGAAPEVGTYRSPALLVQARDIALSGLFFVLFHLGPGRYSLEMPACGGRRVREQLDWQFPGLLLRMSLALPLLVGGFFLGFSNIQSFGTPAWILIPLGLLILLSVQPRIIGVLAALLMVYYIGRTINLDNSLIANLNAFKREIALLCAAIVFAWLGGGERFDWRNLKSLWHF